MSKDIGIVYPWPFRGLPELYLVFDFVRQKTLFGPATRQECQAWMRENAA